MSGAWLARIDSVQISGDLVEVSATLWNDADKFSQLFHTDGSEQSFLDQVTAVTASRAEVVARKQELERGMTFTLAPVVYPTPAAPSKEDEAQSAFFQLNALVASDERGIARGLIASDDAVYRERLARLKALFQDRYRGNL
ncbi:MAG: hypothetical protein JWM95_758 [Gemmatimonadetes bacterium]|nr:hypothetical protein [Gemmatimonadota bacterium]